VVPVLGTLFDKDVMVIRAAQGSAWPGAIPISSWHVRDAGCIREGSRTNGIGLVRVPLLPWKASKDAFFSIGRRKVQPWPFRRWKQ